MTSFIVWDTLVTRYPGNGYVVAATYEDLSFCLDILEHTTAWIVFATRTDCSLVVRVEVYVSRWPMIAEARPCSRTRRWLKVLLLGLGACQVLVTCHCERRARSAGLLLPHLP